MERVLVNRLTYRLIVRGTQHGQVRFTQQGQDALPVQAWRSCLGEAQQVFEIGQCRRLQDESRGHLKGNVFSRACQEVSEALLERDGGSRSHLCSDGCSEGVH